MKTAEEVILMKELELQKIRTEIEALRIAAQLLGDQPEAAQPSPKRTAKIVQLP